MTAEGIQFAPRLRRGVVEAFILRAVGVGLLFLMNLVLGRLLGADGYGTYSYTLALAGLLSVVVPLGAPTALMRFIAQYVEQRCWALLRGAVQRAYQITFLSSGLAALVLWGISYWRGIPLELVTSLRFAALLLPFLAFVNLRRKALQGLQCVKASIIPEEVILPLLVIAGMYLFAVTTTSSALLIYAGAALVTFLLGSILLLQSMPPQGRAAKPEFKTRYWMSVALPMLFGNVSQIIMNRTNILMLGVMVDMQSVGLYSAANRIAYVMAFVLMAVDTIAAPMMASAFYGGHLQQVGTIMRKGMLFSAAGALPLFLVMVFWPQFLLSLFGPEFVHGALLLRFLALGQFVNAATGPVGFALLMVGQERVFAYTTGAVAVGNVAGNLIAIPMWGAVGAAAVTAASVAILNSCLLLLASKKLSPRNSAGTNA